MPISIVILYALVISVFIVDQLSSLVDAHWQIVEFSFRDPWHVGITIFWGVVIVWILSCIKRKQPSTPKTFLYLVFVCVAFLILEILDATHPTSVVIYSFQALEILIWFVCYTMCLYSNTLKSWFSPAADTNQSA